MRGGRKEVGGMIRRVGVSLVGCVVVVLAVSVLATLCVGASGGGKQAFVFLEDEFEVYLAVKGGELIDKEQWIRQHPEHQDHVHKTTPVCVCICVSVCVPFLVADVCLLVPSPSCPCLACLGHAFVW